MKQHVSFNLYSSQLEKLKEIVPSETRNKSRFLRQYLKTTYQLTSDHEKLKLDSEEELISDHIILDEESIVILDSHLKKVKKAIPNANRSTIMRDVINHYISNGDPDLSEKYSRSFYVKEGTKKKLDKFIPSRDRSLVLDFYIKSEYRGPNVSTAKLKEKLTAREQIIVHFHHAAYEKLDSFADKYNVNRVHIFRDAVEQFLIEQEKEEKPQNEELKQAFDELEQRFTSKQIKDYLTKYKTRGLSGDE